MTGPLYELLPKYHKQNSYKKFHKKYQHKQDEANERSKQYRLNWQQTSRNPCLLEIWTKVNESWCKNRIRIDTNPSGATESTVFLDLLGASKTRTLISFRVWVNDKLRKEGNPSRMRFKLISEQRALWTRPGRECGQVNAVTATRQGTMSAIVAEHALYTLLHDSSNWYAWGTLYAFRCFSSAVRRLANGAMAARRRSLKDKP